MKYLDRDDLRKMVKEVAEASVIKDYSGHITYKVENGEKREMFHIFETQEEVDLLDKNLQEKK